MIAHLLADTRVRFLIAGGSAALLNWLVRFPLSLVMSYGAAVLVALVIGMIYGFVIYRLWAFGSPGTRSILLEIRDFILVNAAGAACTIIVALIARAGLLAMDVPLIAAEGIAHAAGIACGAVVNYTGHRRVTFRA